MIMPNLINRMEVIFATIAGADVSLVLLVEMKL